MVRAGGLNRLRWFVFSGVGRGSVFSGAGRRLDKDFNSTGSAGVRLTFSARTYETQGLEATSSTSANAQEEGGIYSATNGTITFTPQKSSCPGPDAVHSLSYVFSGSSLVLYPRQVSRSDRNTDSSATISVAFGCFQPDGSAPRPIAPVGNSPPSARSSSAVSSWRRKLT